MSDDESAIASIGEEAHRYAGGVGIDPATGTAVTVEAPTTDLPRSVRRYLMPTENDRNIIVIRRHWAALGRQLTILIAALAIAITANSLLYQAHHASLLAVRIVWAPVALAVIWYAAHAVTWYTQWIVITPVRIMTVGGLIRRNVIPLPMKRARDVELTQTAPGRLLGYGSIRTQSFGTDHQLAVIRFVPEVDEVFNTIWRILLPGEGGVMPGEVELCSAVLTISAHADPSR